MGFMAISSEFKNRYVASKRSLKMSIGEVAHGSDVACHCFECPETDLHWLCVKIGHADPQNAAESPKLKRRM